MIGSLGRQPTEDKLTIYIKQDSDPHIKEMLPTLVEQSPDICRRRSDQGLPTAVEGSGTASRLLNRYRQQTPLDVPNDLLRTIEEVDRTKSPVESGETYDRSPGPLINSTPPAPILSATEREKKRYQRTMVRLMNQIRWKCVDLMRLCWLFTDSQHAAFEIAGETDQHVRYQRVGWNDCVHSNYSGEKSEREE